MKIFMLSFALLVLAAPSIASAKGGDRVLSDLVKTGSIVHPNGITGGK
ncbi:MAG: hypothetical protein KDJ37_00385 [Hyphomicrobiaceae bacterium]|nr:hypothetical protein [Hyphomicrobiaceae bacterium]